MSALTSIEATPGRDCDSRSRDAGRSVSRGRPLRLVVAADSRERPRSAKPCSSSIRAAAELRPRPPAQARRAAAQFPAPLRLTRRGRLVIATATVLVGTVAALTISIIVSGGAQASNHGQARAGYQGMHQVVVRPGQTLWSIAVAAEPAADPRLVIEQILAVNALPSSQLRAGQLLWVPN